MNWLKTPPLFTGNAEERWQQISNYLYQLVETINVSLGEVGDESTEVDARAMEEIRNLSREVDDALASVRKSVEELDIMQSSIYDPGQVKKSVAFKEDLGGYVPKTGGTFTGSVYSDGYFNSGSDTETGATGCWAWNDKGRVGVHVATTGNRGVYDTTNGAWMIYSRQNEDVRRITGDLIVSGTVTSSNIGTIVNGTGIGTKPVDSGAWTSVGSISLPSGTWIVTGVASLPNGNFKSGLSLSSTNSNYDSECTEYCNYLRWSTLSRIVTVDSQTTIYLVGYQASGSEGSIVSRKLQAVRIT